jgi:hypothetical protein
MGHDRIDHVVFKYAEAAISISELAVMSVDQSELELIGRYSNRV